MFYRIEFLIAKNVINRFYFEFPGVTLTAKLSSFAIKNTFKKKLSNQDNIMITRTVFKVNV